MLRFALLATGLIAVAGLPSALAQDDEAAKQLKKQIEQLRQENRQLREENQQLRARGAKEGKDKKLPTDLLTVGSKWSQKYPTGVIATFTVTSRSDTEVVLERPSIDNKGFIVVTLKVEGPKLFVRRVGYRGPNNRTDQTLQSSASFKGDKLSLSYRVLTDGANAWEESHLLTLEKE